MAELLQCTVKKHHLSSHLAYFWKQIPAFMLGNLFFIKSLLVVYVQETHSLLNLKFSRTNFIAANTRST